VRAKAAEVSLEIWSAADRGEPFDALIFDVDAFRQAGGVPEQARDALGSKGNLTAIVLIDPSRRGEIATLKERGFDAYLVRPVRPASLFAQLHAPADAQDWQGDERAPRISAVPYKAAPAQASRRVLLAEDNEINALLARKMLEKAGCDVLHARNGREAADEVSKALDGDGVFDVILMDIHMPEMDGVESARRIRAAYAKAEGGKRRPPIIALTANAFPEDREQYLEAGLDDYLAKPFEKEDLEAILSKWTEEPVGKVKASAALSG
jgi:CheY-like chemotaxis protein